jgi:hypothetical protein
MNGVATSVFAVMVGVVVLGGAPLRAGIVVNEVLANEPGSYTTLEWIEIYNDAPVAASLQGYQLKVGDRWIPLPDSIQLDGYEYYIICRRLFSDGGSPGFEGIWGDSSGVWGDAPEEVGLRTPWQVTFQLTNSSGAVELYNATLTLVSYLSWNEAGQDGYSWERISPQSSEIKQSVDPSGSTPGMINSHTPVAYDLALEEVTVTPDNGWTTLTFTVVNRGLNPVESARLYLYDTASSPMTVVDSFDVGGIAPGENRVVSREYSFDSIYIGLAAVLSDDDRNRNNRRDFVATGEDFPPVILSELLANPTGSLETEWIELKNRLDYPVSIDGWRLGDSLVRHVITDTTLIIGPFGYSVIAKDTTAFSAYYPDYDQDIIQPRQWPPFNDDTDVVRLIDRYGFEADRFFYLNTFPENYTWSRGEEFGYEDKWGRSEHRGGSPGEINTVLYEASSSSLTVTIEPAVFSPDGDGYEDSVVITAQVPSGAALTMKVYDREGRLVHTLIDGERYLKSGYVWYGRSDSGRRLPIGIYILYVEAAGGASIKKPIVIAR